MPVVYCSIDCSVFADFTVVYCSIYCSDFADMTVVYCIIYYNVQNVIVSVIEGFYIVE